MKLDTLEGLYVEALRDLFNAESLRSTSQPTTSATSELRPEERGGTFRELLGPRPLLPHLQGDELGLALVHFEGLELGKGVFPVEDVQVRLVVQPKGTIVEIRRVY